MLPFLIKMAPRTFYNYKNLFKMFYSGATFVAFDTETTGLKPQTDHVIEIGAIKFDFNGVIGEPFDMLIHPPCSIPPFIQDLTGITDEEVANKPSIDEVLPLFIDYIGERKTILVAHNALFDLGFINNELSRLNMKSLPNLYFDTLNGARWAYPELKNENEKGSYKLQNLAKRFGIEVQKAHRASDDARVCMELFRLIAKKNESLK